MTFKQISEMVASVGLPYAYYQFPDDTVKAPPFVCFYFPGNDDFVADNINYSKIEQLVIELYTDNKDFALESKIESILAANELVYSRVETVIDTEKMFEVTYTMEVLING